MVGSATEGEGPEIWEKAERERKRVSGGEHDWVKRKEKEDRVSDGRACEREKEIEKRWISYET